MREISGTPEGKRGYDAITCLPSFWYNPQMTEAVVKQMSGL